MFGSKHTILHSYELHHWWACQSTQNRYIAVCKSHNLVFSPEAEYAVMRCDVYWKVKQVTHMCLPVISFGVSTVLGLLGSFHIMTDMRMRLNNFVLQWCCCCTAAARVQCVTVGSNRRDNEFELIRVYGVLAWCIRVEHYTLNLSVLMIR